MKRLKKLGLLVSFMILVAGCGGETVPGGENCSGENCSPPPCEGANCATPVDPGQPVAPSLPPEQQGKLDALRKKLDATASQTADTLLVERAVPFASVLPYDPLQAQNFSLLTASALAPSAGELVSLKERGFSISDKHLFPTFTYGYASIYLEDLPVYISADSLLHAVHKSYSKGLSSMELALLRGDVEAMLTATRQRLGQGGAAWMPAEARADLDLVLGLGLSLLTGAKVPLVAGGDEALLASLFDKAVAAEGITAIRLFGTNRVVDFSQFKPRGHYAENPFLQLYFRAMMWFGRTEFRLMETDGNTGQQIFRRRQLEAALGLVDLLQGDALQRFQRVDRVIGLFVGENDSMTPLDGAKFLGDLGLQDGSGLAAFDDKALVQKLMDGGYGAQRIASQLMTNDRHKTLPLHRAFQLFGQRYTVDSHVFSNVVFDRAGGGAIKRMMPDPLDGAFAALKNDQAVSLLAPGLKQHSYAPDLAAMRLLVDDHEASYWDGSLYTLWLSSLRELSPGPMEGLPAVAKTEAWGRRMLNAQLGSWAELRHDTLLYAKQSYTSGALCAFPDAYVDPYPAFYERLARYAERGGQMLEEIPPGPASQIVGQLRAHFKELLRVASMLQQMAEHQRTGQPFSDEQMAFINDAVVLKEEISGCVAETVAKGWYPGLILGDSLEYDPTIADVHTQPTDESGNQVGKVLHVGTGGPRRMIITVDTCTGPRAYVGLVNAYSEKVTEQFRRLDDEEWSQELGGKGAPPVPWMNDLISP